MDKNLVRDIPLPAAAMAGCAARELARSNSDSSSVTADGCSKDWKNATTPGPSTVWTDEKHRLYIDSLEALFVDQLHRSIGLCGYSREALWRPHSSQELPANGCCSSHQFTVQQDGCRRKLNFESSERILESTADSDLSQKRQCLHHSTSAGKRHSAAFHDLQERTAPSTKGTYITANPTVSVSARISEELPRCHQSYEDSVSCTIEVSDQNFPDEEQGEKPSCVSMAKRLKTGGADALGNEQVVPCGKSDRRDILSLSQASSERAQVHQELLSENPDNFTCLRSVPQHFLKGR